MRRVYLYANSADSTFRVISSSITHLLKDLEYTCDPFFLAMSRTQWSTIETVSGQMIYVLDLVRSIDTVVDGIRSSVEQKKYLRNFYDKAAP